MEKGNKYPQVNPSQSQVSKYFFLYLNMGEISHPVFRCTAFKTVKRETEGDKKTVFGILSCQTQQSWFRGLIVF